MIDIHSHILPLVDDGAKGWEETIEMAAQAAADGIYAVIATPHHANGRYVNEADKVNALIAEANDKIREAGIHLQVLAGQEIRVYDDLLKDWEQQKLLSLAGSRYILLEFPTSHVPSNAEDLIHELSVMGMQPIIAHPERCTPIADNPKLLRRLIDAGALGQITAQSVMGERGRNLQKLSFSLISEGLAHFVATDAHNTVHRPFLLSRGYREIEKELGSRARDILADNAERVVSNSPIELVRGIVNKRKNMFNFILGSKN